MVVHIPWEDEVWVQFPALRNVLMESGRHVGVAQW